MEFVGHELKHQYSNDSDSIADFKHVQLQVEILIHKALTGRRYNSVRKLVQIHSELNFIQTQYGEDQ